MNIVLILIICTIYSFILYFILKTRIDSRVNNKKFLREVREEISSLVTQINETSDRNVTLLENRLERLNSLLAEADTKIALLKNNIKVNNEPVIQSRKVVEVKEEVKTTPKERLDINLVEDDKSLSTKERIILLHKQGISTSVIARKTESTIGEVELIITLNRG